VALLTVEELEVAVGTSFSDADAARAQYYIDGLSAYIEKKTGTTFSVVEDAVERFRADPYGVVKFTLLPVTAVTTVHDFATDTDLEPGGWVWDGLSRLTNLCGHQVVDVTYSYGLEPPADVKWAATEAVKRGINTANNSNLVLKQVGDVIHQFGTMLPLTEAEQEIFNSYGVTEWTLKLGPGGDLPPNYYSYYPFDVTRGSYYDD